MADFTIRDATPQDINFVAECVLAALSMYNFKDDIPELEIARKVCARQDTIYSYKNARIGVIDGTPIGCMVSYPGTIYESARKITFGIIEGESGTQMPQTETEAYPDEYYLDSLAILPAFRGERIGRILMQDAIDIGKRLGFKKMSLIVESAYGRLADYYATLGFKPEREIDAYGEKYIRMVLTI